MSDVFFECSIEDKASFVCNFSIFTSVSTSILETAGVSLALVLICVFGVLVCLPLLRISVATGMAVRDLVGIRNCLLRTYKLRVMQCLLGVLVCIGCLGI